ncbi:MAG: methylmalonyl Co-A mutase-associated GTPase MeaB [Pseudomonadota bacterium]
MRRSAKGQAIGLDQLRAGGKPALARALSAVETGRSDALLDAAFTAPKGVVLGLTGPPGVGKSTLTAALIPRLRSQGRRVGVIAVDPSSRRSGGALLGDRTRIRHDPMDDGVFIRSMAARDRLGGVAEVTFSAMVLMRATQDVVIVETVGVGQSEAEIADLADAVVFCAEPGAGDALQFMKAGVVETPDLVLVTKGDAGPQAQRTAADLRGALSLAAQQPVPVAVVSAMHAAGLDVLDPLLGRLAGDAGALGQRRACQAAVWVRAQIQADFGRIGLGAIESELPSRCDAPFSRLTQLKSKLSVKKD